MPLHRVPPLTEERLDRLEEIERLHDTLAFHVRADRWRGRLRRQQLSAVAVASTAIEGFQARQGQAEAIAEGRAPDDMAPADLEAVRGYERAMDRVLSWGSDPNFEWSRMALLVLHGDVEYPHRGAGLLRTVGVGVSRGDRMLYQAPEAHSVLSLVDELVEDLAQEEASPTIVRAAMAHYRFVSIHPFEDGNGRTARVLQALVLAREGTVPPELASIEEYLADHTDAYYEALQRSQGGDYDPQRDASPWLDFALKAHLQQAGVLEQRVIQTYARNDFAERLAEAGGYPSRTAIALDDALRGVPVRSADYAHEHGIAAVSAHRDLRQLVAADWLQVRGAGPSTSYLATPKLREQWDVARATPAPLYRPEARPRVVSAEEARQREGGRTSSRRRALLRNGSATPAEPPPSASTAATSRMPDRRSREREH